MYGKEKYLETGGIQFKVQSMTLSFYNKPKKDSKTKILIQGKDKDGIIEYVFEVLPKVYREVSEMGKNEIQGGEKDINCDDCDYKTKDIPIMQEHIEMEHLVSYRKKVQSKMISAYKCEICPFSVPTRSSLKIHVNTKHKKQKQSKKSILIVNTEDNTMDPPEKGVQKLERSNINIEVSQVIEELLCKVCDTSFITENDVTNHMKNLHVVGPKEAEEEKGEVQVSPLQSNVKIPEKVVKPLPLFKCDECAFMTRTEENVNVHKKRKHCHKNTDIVKISESSTYLHSCISCAYKTNIYDDLRNHTQKHIPTLSVKNVTKSTTKTKT